MDVSEMLDRLYYEMVLGAADASAARAGLERVLADVADLRDTLDLYGLDVVADAVTKAQRGEQVLV